MPLDKIAFLSGSISSSHFIVSSPPIPSATVKSIVTASKGLFENSGIKKGAFEYPLFSKELFVCAFDSQALNLLTRQPATFLQAVLNEFYIFY